MMKGVSPAQARVRLFLAIVLAWQALVLGRVAYLKLVQGEHYQGLARAQKQRLVRTPPQRGRILDRCLEPLAVSVPLHSVFVYTPELGDREATAQSLAGALGRPVEDVRARLTGDARFRYVQRFMSDREVAPVRALHLSGVGVMVENRRLYPNGDLAAHVLGAVTHVDGFEVGLEGLEKTYDELLSGSPGEVLLKRAGRSRVVSVQEITEPQPGHTLVLNIDHRIQHIAQSRLARAVAETGSRAGQVVVMDPGNGDVLALASWPDFDPNDLRKARPAHLRNAAIESIMEPGSTFKIVATGAALEEGLTRLDEIIHCGDGHIVISGHVIRDHKSFGNLNVSQILEESSDVGVIKLAQRLGERVLHRYIRAFGFGQRSGVDLPAEVNGLLRPPQRWSRISIGAIAMGQEVGVTALQITRAMAVVANDGWLVQPRIVGRVLDAQGRLVRAHTPERDRVLSPRVAGLVRDALVRTVERGTGRRAAVPGYRVAGKTGTAQKIDPQTRAYSQHEYVASFVGFAPADRPVIVVGVILDSPYPRYHGGEVSAPVFADIARQVLVLRQVPPTEPVLRPEMVHAPSPPSEPVRSGPAVGSGDTLLNRSPGGPREIVITVAARDAIEMPDLLGLGMREVVRACARLGLLLEPSGSGVAVAQLPPAGALTRAGERCGVWFSGDPGRLVEAGVDPRSLPHPGARTARARTVRAGQTP